ncbi:PREDICTED: zinc finger protein 638 isoform X1 [Elephantulus edwardii]|uniref:zinc finger protein 638 isoform X1 n=1 Tax=Elephantulus edwardii TaxID=28737 RepID=UPI0003F0B431|nr:PREDICTED: zinc finger protein 638 isoform X1 [Elephantulus edwardii]
MSRPRFNPRGNFPLPRPRAPNPSGMRPPGPFMRPGSMGLPRFYSAGRAQGIPQRFAGHEPYQNMGPQRMNVQVTQHRTDPRLTKEKLDFHEAEQKKEKPLGGRWEESHLSASVGMKPSAVAAEPSPKVQSRYTKESASSILASFGLSNEDLEELSRYPDEQLTPENMPLILRDIRMRKMGRRLPNLPSQSRNKEILGTEAVSRNVIDYGHASKYGYTEDPLEVRIYDPEIPTDEGKNEFPSQQSISGSTPASNVICDSMFPVEDVFRQMDFPNESSDNQSFFSIESGTKMSGLHMSGGQSVLEPVKSVSQPISQTSSQTVSQSLVTSSVNQQPFSKELISTVSQQERISHEPVMDSSKVSGGSKKNYQSETDEPFRSPFGIVKASWLPKFSHAGAQKMKRLPTPSMMNDYYAASPRIFPHLCSLCNVECSHLKDWIQHQNTSTHIESCRQLRQQYPDWNPEILPSRRNEGDKKEDRTPRRRSHSPSPRRSRRSSSSHRLRRSRSPVRYIYRPRSRSPRLCHRFVSRYRSRSPNPSHRLRNPVSPDFYRSVRPERTSRRSVRSPDREKAVEDVAQRSVHGAETGKKKHSEPSDKGHSPAQKSKPSTGSKPSVKSSGSAKSDSSTRYKPKNPEDNNLPESKETAEKPVQRKVSDSAIYLSSAIVVSELPEDGCTEEDIRKVFQPLGKLNEILVVPYRREAYLEMELKESVSAIFKYIEKTPLNIKGTRVKISVPGKKKSQSKDVKKKPSDSKKTSTLKKDSDPSKTVETVTSTSTTTKIGQAKPSAKVNKPSGKSSSAVKSVITVAAKGNKASVKIAKPIGKKSLEVKKPGIVKNKDSTKPLMEPENSDVKTNVEDKAAENSIKETVTAAASKKTEKHGPVSKETEGMCVVLVGNLPTKGYSVEDICNLAKPFGGLNDILLLSSHNKAFIEISKKSGDSMVKFYNCFPISLDGNQLSLSMAPDNVAIKDEEAIFMTLIKESDPEASIEKNYNRFVHFDNLPEDGLQCVLCIGLQFGKVVHHIFMNNKNKAILQLDSPESAQSVYHFLKENPQNIGDYVLTCTLSPKIDILEVRGVLEKDSEQGRESPDLKNNPVDENEVQTAADSPSVKHDEVEEESASSIQAEPSVQLEEPCEEQLEKTLSDSDFALVPLEVEPQGEEIKVEIPLVASTPGCIELFTEDVEESTLNQHVFSTDFEKEEAEIVNPETDFPTSDSLFLEEGNIKEILEESPSETEDFFSGITQSMVEAVAEVDKHETVSERVPSACVVAMVPGISTEDETVMSRKGISEKSSFNEREESEFNTLDLQTRREEVEQSEAEMITEKLGKNVEVMKEKPVENTIAKAHSSKGGAQASKSDEMSKTTVSALSSRKSPIKAALVSSPRVKATTPKSENQKSFLKSVLRDQINAEKKLAARELGFHKLLSAGSGMAESSKFRLAQSGGARVGSGRFSAPQGKASKLDYRDSKQSQETPVKSSVMKRDDSNKTSVGQNTKNSKSATGRSSKSKEEPLFPFNLDEFVTVDEVIEEVNPSQAKQNPPKAKRKEAFKTMPSSPLNVKRKKGESCARHVVEGEVSFVTLDEIGEDDDAAAPLAQALVTVDEVIDEEELNMEEMVKDSNTLLTLDELIDQDDSISHGEPKDVTVLLVAEEDDLLKQERLVTVDEIGEVEELPLNESTDITFATLNSKGDEGNTVRDPIDFISSQMPEDPSTLVTVDEIQEENNDLHLVTLDEVTEEDEDALADFNNLKEELNFVTVDEVGEEEDRETDLKVELAHIKTDPIGRKVDRIKRGVGPKKTKLPLSQVNQESETPKGEDLKGMVESHFSAKAPTKRVRAEETPPSEKVVASKPEEEEAFKISEVEGDPDDLSSSEPEQKRMKTEDDDSALGRSEDPDVPADEKAMTSHCKSTRHKQNTEKFMAKQRKEKEHETEERSSR